MKKISLILITLLLSIQFSVQADEGMWLLSLLTKMNLNKKGLVLSTADIYSINHSSIKDAVVGLGSANNPLRFYCTAEIVSDQGLILTNHHCGFGAIQSHSTPEHDYLTDGFWAMNKNEELINKGTVASILVRMEDVSDYILPKLNESMSEKDRYSKIKELSDKLIEKAIEGSHYLANVKSMYDGNKFYLFVYETFKDIRLVGAPPSAIGKFGGDTDNWMWPRHTGDFSMFRIYAGSDGKPAEYNEKNRAYSPKYHFPISLKGEQMDDFAMVMGYPGSTDRYMTSYGIKDKLSVEYPARISLRGKKLEIMKQEMNKSKKVEIQYASKYARVSNYWKYFIGQSRGLKRLAVYDKKKKYEQELQNWINADKTRIDKYGDALKMIEEAYAEKSILNKSLQYFYEGLRGVEISSFPRNAYYILYPLLKDKNTSKDEIAKAVSRLREISDKYYKDYDQTTDKKMLAAIFTMFVDNVDPQYFPEIITKINKKCKGNFAKYADKLFSKSIFADKNKFEAFLKNPSLKKLEKDPAFKLYLSIDEKTKELRTAISPSATKLEKGRRLFMAAMLEKEKNKTFYPNANSTPRLTYGYVGNYKPADAIRYSYFTTIDGIMEKEDPNSEEFIVPAKLKKLYKNKDYGQYADKDKNLHVCFTSNNDITGGNSGSPVINANGELIGIAFDGNWEAMSGDIAFEPQLQKCINVDIRYVLFIIDKYAGATNLIDEMTLLK